MRSRCTRPLVSWPRELSDAIAGAPPRLVDSHVGVAHTHAHVHRCVAAAIPARGAADEAAVAHSPCARAHVGVAYSGLRAHRTDRALRGVNGRVADAQIDVEIAHEAVHVE